MIRREENGKVCNKRSRTDAFLISRVRARGVGLSVKRVPLRSSVRDTFRSSSSPYVIGNGGRRERGREEEEEFSSTVHDCVRSLAIIYIVIARSSIRINSLEVDHLKRTGNK